MNQRSFFKSLVLIGAAASLSPQIFIPKFEPVRWKVSQAAPRGLYYCEFKFVFLDQPGIYDDIILYERVGPGDEFKLLTGRREPVSVPV